jgi:hypothetical protein
MSESYTDRPNPERQPAQDAEFVTPEPDGALPKLGSLAQSARSGQLIQAKRLLIGVGLIMAVLNFGMMFTVRAQIATAIDTQLQARGGRAAADPVQLRQIEEGLVILGYCLQAIPVALGLLFIGFGLIVNRFPVPITIISLVLFVSFILLTAVLDPTTLIQGIVLKIIFIAGIFKAIQAAFAYEREKREQAAFQPEY